MDFIDRIRELAARIPKQLEHIATEEATKSALVMPFIAALGYDVFNPAEVTPELNADVGLKKGEKVDYAIMQDGKPIILFECKHHTADLSLAHASQLYRYFSVTEARFAILTNGVVYRFYTDLDAPNKMDSRPFLELDMLNLDERLVDELKKFSKSAFNVETILNTATELRYTREIKALVAQQMQEPSPEFVRFFVAQVYSGRMTQSVREQFDQIARRAFRHYINDQINERLKSALGADAPIIGSSSPVAAPTSAETVGETDERGRTVETTEEEQEAFYIVRAILREVVEVRRVMIKDAQSYCAILLDNNNRRPLIRLHFNSTRKSVSLFDADKSGERVAVQGVDDLYTLADRLKATAKQYL